MNDVNKKYYKRVYDRVYASDELRERVLNMDKKSDCMGGTEQKKGKKSYRRTWRVAAAAAAVLAVAVPSGVYAATNYWGFHDFLGYSLTKEASSLVENDVEQTIDGKDNEKMPVVFTVKEALCDSGSVNIILEAKIKEAQRGKYLLVYQGLSLTEPVENLGIDEQMTIGEYAKSRGLQVLYISHDFADSSGFSQSARTVDYALTDDDTMFLYLSVRKESDNKKLDVAVQCSAGGVSSIINCKLQDRSSSTKMAYTSNKKITLRDVGAVVTKVTMEKSALNTYVNIYYRYKGKTKEQIENDGLFFRVKDSIGEERGGRWDQAQFDGTGGIEEGDGVYCCRLAYNSMELPKKCVLEAYDIRNSEKGIIFGEIEITKVKKEQRDKK